MKINKKFDQKFWQSCRTTTQINNRTRCSYSWLNIILITCRTFKNTNSLIKPVSLQVNVSMDLLFCNSIFIHTRNLSSNRNLWHRKHFRFYRNNSRDISKFFHSINPLLRGCKSIHNNRVLENTKGFKTNSYFEPNNRNRLFYSILILQHT